MDVPQNTTPELVTSLFDTILSYISRYGWHFVFFLVVLNLLWSHFRPKWQKWRAKMREQKQAAEYHRNPEQVAAMQEAFLRSRQRLQEEHDRLARERAEQLKLQEEQKRQEKIKKWECLQKGKSLLEEETTNADHGQRPKKSKPFRETSFNPLMGSSSGSTYRPSRRSGASGGGGG